MDQTDYNLVKEIRDLLQAILSELQKLNANNSRSG